MTDNVNHPAHYTQGPETRPIECIDITQYMGFCDGNAFKYVWRAGKKGDRAKTVEDLDKALWYLDRICVMRGVAEVSGRVLAVFSLVEQPPIPDKPVFGLTDRSRYYVLYSIAHGHWEEARLALGKIIREEKVKDEGGVL